MTLEQPERYCPNCAALIPNNQERRWMHAEEKLGHEPTPEELEGFRPMVGLLACEGCARAAAMPKAKLGPPAEQLKIEAPMIWVG